MKKKLRAKCFLEANYFRCKHDIPRAGTLNLKLKLTVSFYGTKMTSNFFPNNLLVCNYGLLVKEDCLSTLCMKFQQILQLFS